MYLIKPSTKQSRTSEGGGVDLPDGFAAAGGHDDEAIPSIQDLLYDLPLVGSERRVAEIALHKCNIQKRPGLDQCQELGF